MPTNSPLQNWFYAILGGMAIGALFILLSLIEGNLSRNLTWEDMLLFCLTIGLGFATAAMSLVQWEDRKKQISPSTLTSPGWLLGEWILIFLWTTALLSLSMSTAVFFYSGDWFLLVMLAVFGPLSALLAAHFVSRNRSLQGEMTSERRLNRALGVAGSCAVQASFLYEENRGSSNVPSLQKKYPSS